MIGADAFAEIGTWKDYPDDSGPRALRRRLAARAVRSTQSAARGCRCSRRGWCGCPLDQLSDVDPVIILIDAPTADVSSTAIRQRRADGESIAGLVRPARCSNTLSSTDFTRR